MSDGNPEFIRTSGSDFVVDGKPVMLRGFGIANWLNLEHFMLRVPGTESQLRAAVDAVYGGERAAQFWRRYRECFFGEGDIRWLAGLGVNAIRMPLNHHCFDSAERPDAIDEGVFEELDRAIETCGRHGIYVILDLHTAPGGQNPDWHSDNAVGEAQFWEQPEHQSRAVALWRVVARRYRDQAWVGGYDLLNEPSRTSGPAEAVPRFFERALRAVREVDPEHLVFFEGDAYATDFGAFEPGDDPNLAYTFHYYPFVGRMGHRDDPAYATAEGGLRQHVPLADLRERLGRPLWCGETGASLEALDRGTEERQLAEMIEVLERERISWSLWPHKDAGAMGALHVADGSPWARFARRACGGWRHLEDWRTAEQEIERLQSHYGATVDLPTRRKLEHRILANRQLVLVARLVEVLRSIPFEELLTYPESFRIEECDTWPALVDLVRRHTGRENESEYNSKP